MEYGAFTCKGSQRKSNEDYYYIPEPDRTGCEFIIIADGMGGHNAGDLASRTAVELISSYLCEKAKDHKDKKLLVESMYQAITEANKKIYDMSKSDERLLGMGTTLTMAVFAHGLVYIAHIGDSRCYIIKGNEVRQITRDHSLVQELLDNGSITADEMSVHPNRNIITRALGTEETLKIDLFEEIISDGDIVVLCSDGLSNYVKLDEEFRNISGDLPVCELVKELGAKALAAGSTDDITIVAARYTGYEEER